MALANRAAVLEDGASADIEEVSDADDIAAGTAGLYALALVATVVIGCDTRLPTTAGEHRKDSSFLW